MSDTTTYVMNRNYSLTCWNIVPQYMAMSNINNMDLLIQLYLYYFNALCRWDLMVTQILKVKILHIEFVITLPNVQTLKMRQSKVTAKTRLMCAVQTSKNLFKFYGLETTLLKFIQNILTIVRLKTNKLHYCCSSKYLDASAIVFNKLISFSQRKNKGIYLAQLFKTAKKLTSF